MLKQMLTLTFKQYKVLGSLIDANAGISPIQNKMKMNDFEVLRKRGLAISSNHYGRRIYFIAPKFNTDHVIAYQNIKFETECCNEPGNHEFIADGYVHCLDCDNTHAKLKMVK